MSESVIDISYDDEVDAAYIKLTKDIAYGAATDTVILGQEDDRVKTMINLDFDKDGRILGVEVLDASKIFQADLFNQIKSSN